MNAHVSVFGCFSVVGRSTHLAEVGIQNAFPLNAHVILIIRSTVVRLGSAHGDYGDVLGRNIRLAVLIFKDVVIGHVVARQTHRQGVSHGSGVGIVRRGAAEYGIAQHPLLIVAHQTHHLKVKFGVRQGVVGLSVVQNNGCHGSRSLVDGQLTLRDLDIVVAVSLGIHRDHVGINVPGIGIDGSQSGSLVFQAQNVVYIILIDGGQSLRCERILMHRELVSVVGLTLGIDLDVQTLLVDGHGSGHDLDLVVAGLLTKGLDHRRIRIRLLPCVHSRYGLALVGQDLEYLLVPIQALAAFHLVGKVFIRRTVVHLAQLLAQLDGQGPLGDFEGALDVALLGKVVVAVRRQGYRCGVILAHVHLVTGVDHAGDQHIPIPGNTPHKSVDGAYLLVSVVLKGILGGPLDSRNGTLLDLKGGFAPGQRVVGIGGRSRHAVTHTGVLLSAAEGQGNVVLTQSLHRCTGALLGAVVHEGAILVPGDAQRIGRDHHRPRDVVLCDPILGRGIAVQLNGDVVFTDVPHAVPRQTGVDLVVVDRIQSLCRQGLVPRLVHRILGQMPIKAQLLLLKAHGDGLLRRSGEGGGIGVSRYAQRVGRGVLRVEVRDDIILFLTQNLIQYPFVFQRNILVGRRCLSGQRHVFTVNHAGNLVTLVILSRQAVDSGQIQLPLGIHVQGRAAGQTLKLCGQIRQVVSVGACQPRQRKAVSAGDLHDHLCRAVGGGQLIGDIFPVGIKARVGGIQRIQRIVVLAEVNGIYAIKSHVYLNGFPNGSRRKIVPFTIPQPTEYLRILIDVAPVQLAFIGHVGIADAVIRGVAQIRPHVQGLVDRAEPGGQDLPVGQLQGIHIVAGDHVDLVLLEADGLDVIRHVEHLQVFHGQRVEFRAEFIHVGLIHLQAQILVDVNQRVGIQEFQIRRAGKDHVADLLVTEQRAVHALDRQTVELGGDGHGIALTVQNVHGDVVAAAVVQYVHHGTLGARSALTEESVDVQEIDVEANADHKDGRRNQRHNAADRLSAADGMPCVTESGNALKQVHGRQGNEGDGLKDHPIPQGTRGQNRASAGQDDARHVDQHASDGVHESVVREQYLDNEHQIQHEKEDGAHDVFDLGSIHKQHQQYHHVQRQRQDRAEQLKPLGGGYSAFGNGGLWGFLI